MTNKELFCQALVKLVELTEQGIESCERKPSTAELVEALLNLKIISHVCGAAKLLVAGYYPESIILLRSAYEALVMSTYLAQNPNKIQHYETHGILCNLRNMMEFLGQSDLAPELKAQLDGQVTALREAFLQQNGLLYYAELQVADLENFSKVRKASNKALFSHLPGMLAAISYDDETDWMKNSFELYNIGSQVTHSQMEWLAINRFGKTEHAIMSNLSVGRYILMFLNHCLRTMANLGLTRKNVLVDFETHLFAAMESYQAWLKDEQVDMAKRLVT